MTGKTEKQICRGDFWKQSMEDTGWEVYASRILCVVKRISENGVSSNKNFHLHRKRIFFTGKKPCIIYIINMLNNSFHGRTVTTLAATGQDVFHN